MTPDEQLTRWVEGESVHRDGPGGGECCPDFSCCAPELAAPLSTRRKFVSAYRAGDLDVVEELLGEFLEAMAGNALDNMAAVVDRAPRA